MNFSNSCNVFYGKNGTGKTNLLEAISLFSKGRGLKKDKITNIIKKHSNKFHIKSDFYNNNIKYNLITESINKNDKQVKSLKINNDSSKDALESYYKLMSFLHFVPETERLFIASPSKRRNLIDNFIYSYFKEYNTLINFYNKNIVERSKLLTFNKYDLNWLNKIEENISTSGMQIYLFRSKQIKILTKYLNYFFEQFKMSYLVTVNLNDNFYNKDLTIEIFKNYLKENRKDDSLSGGSKIGPHKSDYIFLINDEYLVSQLSTGQQKTLVLLIYLSQCKYLVEEVKVSPILLLDEICSHLDEINRKILLELVESFKLQVFMTGTTKNLFSFLSTNTNFCNITK